MFERFSRSAREVVVGAVGEAERRGEHRVGTEHVLLAVLQQPWSPASVALGTDLETARAALDELDRLALASVGVDATPPPAHPHVPARTRLPFTAGTRAVLVRALAAAGSAGSRTLQPEHLLVGLLGGEPPDPALDLLAQLGIDRAVIRSRLDAAA